MIDTDRERITKKMLAHVNRHSRLRKENPLKPIVFWIAFLLLTPLAVILFVENAQEIDEFFDPNTQQTLLVWWLPIGGILICLGVLWYRYKKM